MKVIKNLLIAALAALASPSFAQMVSNDGYARDASTVVVKNPFGLCWRSGQWADTKAIADCDPDLVPKPVQRAEAPARAAAPAVAPALVEAPRPVPVPIAVAAIPVPARQSITLGADASFDSGKADLKPEGQAKLDQLVAKLKQIDFDSITVTGHTDNVGADAFNQKLSQRRADAVKVYFGKHGIDQSKIKTAGRGKSSPVADNKTAQGRARNRRVEVVISGSRSS
ncbi:MAG TPA: OmpA family protein [Burkholderiales bacterium]|nr:OmpA family protein [Burkholderiales bacterium]